MITILAKLDHFRLLMVSRVA